MKRPMVAAVAGLAVLGMTAAGAYVIASPGGEEEAVEQVETATPSAAPSATVPAESPSPTVSPTLSGELPPPAEGYTWFETPSNWQVLADFAVQVPEDWVRIEDSTFVPPGLPSSFPYPPVPQLTVFVGRVEPNPPDEHPGWQHPFVWRVGQQGGGGCKGDVTDGGVPQVSPSSHYTGPNYTWDTYRFTCGVINLNYPPGVTYDARAAEAHSGGLVFTVLAFEPAGSSLAAAAYQQALDSFRSH